MKYIPAATEPSSSTGWIRASRFLIIAISIADGLWKTFVAQRFHYWKAMESGRNPPEKKNSINNNDWGAQQQQQKR